MRRYNRRPPSEIEEIRQHLESLKQQPWLEQQQRRWPDFLFHCTDVRNVVSILRTGEMLNRTQALALQQLHVDIASPEIIANTNQTWQDYVRLYFRPKTPTQYRNEGFRPITQQTYHAQCPVPVYLIIDAMEVLSKVGVLFTDGNVAAGAQPTDDIDFFKAFLSRRCTTPSRSTIRFQTGSFTTAMLRCWRRNSLVHVCHTLCMLSEPG